MARIIWRRVRSEWVGKAAASGPDLFLVRKTMWPGDSPWKLFDLRTARVGCYSRLMDAKSAAETMK